MNRIRHIMEYLIGCVAHQLFERKTAFHLKIEIEAIEIKHLFKEIIDCDDKIFRNENT